MSDKIRNIVKELIKNLKEESSTQMGGATFNAGEGEAYASKYSFAKKEKPAKYYYKLGYKKVPKKIKGSGLEVKKLFEDNDFHQERINAFDQIEKELNQVAALLSNAKNETAEFYSANPGSYEIVIGTDLILDYLQNIKTLLKGEE